MSTSQTHLQREPRSPHAALGAETEPDARRNRCPPRRATPTSGSPVERRGSWHGPPRLGAPRLVDVR